MHRAAGAPQEPAAAGHAGGRGPAAALAGGHGGVLPGARLPPHAADQQVCAAMLVALLQLPTLAATCPLTNLHADKYARDVQRHAQACDGAAQDGGR
jgi:hypothetical protein